MFKIHVICLFKMMINGEFREFNARRNFFVVVAFYSMHELLFSVNLIFRDLFFRSLPCRLQLVYLHSRSCLLFELECTGWAVHVARMGEEGGVYGVLVGKPEGKRPLGRPRRRWEVNIRMDL
jgi:hypothetical protein